MGESEEFKSSLCGPSRESERSGGRKGESASERREVTKEERDNGEEAKCWGGRRTAMSKLCLTGK